MTKQKKSEIVIQEYGSGESMVEERTMLTYGFIAIQTHIAGKQKINTNTKKLVNSQIHYIYLEFGIDLYIYYLSRNTSYIFNFQNEREKKI